jgi:hypothetical protein
MSPRKLKLESDYFRQVEIIKSAFLRITLLGTDLIVLKVVTCIPRKHNFKRKGSVGIS